MLLMALHELHPYTEAEIATVPQEAGVYVLFQVENPLHVGGAANLRQQLKSEKTRLPQATHFAIETGYASESDAAKRVEKVKNELGRVRVEWFAGPNR
jgi:excinuclease UvrABC nuclease subunit